MMETEPCPKCGTGNAAGSSFCQSCGANLAPQVHCPTCHTLNAVGQRFCTRCGGSLEHAGWAGSAPPGGVIDGTWERGPDEVIRRVDPEDARRFLGTRTVRVPAGTVGVVLVDGVVERVLPPGEQTTLGLFERIANFFLRRERTAFYLVDQRPFMVPFVVRTRPNAAGHSVKSQVLVTLTLPRGDHAGLASFIANVLGDRPAFTTGDLYNLLRPDVARIAQETLERALGTGEEISYPDAEVAIRRALAEVVGPRYGLGVDATLAPLTAIASLNFHLGTGAAPSVRRCTSCKRELPASLSFCDGCGAKQPAVIDPPGGKPSAQSPLFTSDGQQVELDVVVRVQGQHEDFGPERIVPALVGAVAAHLRDRTFTALTSPGGFTALEQAASGAIAEALRGYGLSLVAIAVVDARSKTGQWVLAARADLERAAEDVRLGLSWLEQRDNELDLEQLVLTRILRMQSQQRDHAFARDEATTADRERRDGLAQRGAVLEVAAAQRDGATRAAKDAVEHDKQRRDAAVAIELRATNLEAELAELRARRDLDLEDRARRERLEIDLAAAREQQQLDKLRAMAELDRQIAAQEHAQELEKRGQLQGLSPEAMIAMQAAELARTEGGGAAWASAMAQRGSAETERRHAEEMRALLERQQAGNTGLMDKAMGAMADVAKSRAEAPPVIAGGGPVVTVASTTETPTKTCPSCGARSRADATFCGSCGTAFK
jgi:hypothetical protein